MCYMHYYASFGYLIYITPSLVCKDNIPICNACRLGVHRNQRIKLKIYIYINRHFLSQGTSTILLRVKHFTKQCSKFALVMSRLNQHHIKFIYVLLLKNKIKNIRESHNMNKIVTLNLKTSQVVLQTFLLFIIGILPLRYFSALKP